MTHRLELRDVHFSYPNTGDPVLRGVTCSLQTGSSVALVGSNGSGKSTLAKLMAGQLTPAEGTVLVDGKALTVGWNGIGLLLQNPDEQLLTSSVERELAWGLENLAIPVERIASRVENVLEMFDLNELRRHPPELLSDGQKQLVALAGVLAMEPEFLVLDEATAFLDKQWSIKICEIVEAQAKIRGIIWVSTHLDSCLKVNEIWEIKDGRLV